jgi:SPP1 family predicted phage head-tail adaptor
MSSSGEYKCPAGNLRHRIELQSAVETRDAVGGVQYTWATVVSVWGDIRALNSRETVSNAQVVGRVTHFIKIRQYAALRQTWRVKYGSRIFNITGIRNIDERGKVQVLDAVEETT